MKEPISQTIYSYKLLYRFRWGMIGYMLQWLLMGSSLIGISLYLSIPVARLIVTLAILPAIAICHLILFRLYAQMRMHKPQTTADMLVSPWWGSGYRLPVPLTVYRSGESTVLFGCLFLAAAAYVWLPVEYGLTLLSGTVVLSLPRLLALLASFRQSKQCRVKYENRGVAFLLTDG
ncbi:hypothetical protein EDM59_12215 [Brevibacillus nitrificans]|uniref:DUF3267 domain-containing protein n=1 Tax=Brevibacillus nitrificans TaxID=651560 RepID=A0A3M8DCP4_9BACL|nr:hypothetical protein [Brevibacillus nitrificans]RNB85763.1 hypothetical protein EDM59_12215 [Brevibacillus nitrificans]